jgi:hypothetical protein
MWLLALLPLLLCRGALANPAIEREFHRIVNSDDCLKECMKPVQESDLELSIFKRANYSDYLLNLDRICDVITTARRCVDGCKIKSNPFALISMNSICSEKSRQEAKLLEPCLRSAGPQVHEQCVQACGDYEGLNEQLRLTTSTLKPEDETSAQLAIKQTNENCVVMKCSARCAVDNFNRQCERLENGQPAGQLIQTIVERVLGTHLMDLQVFGLMEAMQKNTQPECNYLYAPDVLFNPVRDQISQQMIRSKQPEESPVVRVPVQQQPQQDAPNELYVKILKKQLRVLDKQLEILNKQEQKMADDIYLQKAPRFYANDPMF